MEVVRRRGVVVGVADVVDASPAECVVWLFNERAAEVGGGCTCQIAVYSGAIGLLAVFDLVVAAFWHVVGVLHEGVDCVVDCFDTVGVVNSELRVVRSLNLLIDNSVDYTESVHANLNTRGRAVLDLLILLVKVVVESRAVMTSVAGKWSAK